MNLKKIISLLILVLSVKIYASDPIKNNLAAAKEKAKTEHKLILLRFSGSDWCIPCINIQKKVFDTPEFQNFANENLVLMEADFPRQKKNRLSKEDQQKNGALAEMYNKDGIFPKLVLMDADGKILTSWDGLKKMDPKFLEDQISPYLTKK